MKALKSNSSSMNQFPGFQVGNLDGLKSLLASMSPHVDFDAYSSWLFTCIDQKQPDIAAHLIRCGCNPEIWTKVKRFPHFGQQTIISFDFQGDSAVSLYEYATKKGFTALANYIDKVRSY
jgi:hypothetical protein